MLLDLDESTRELDVASLENEVKYAGYLKQEASRAERMRKQERRRIPEDFVFAGVPGLSREVIQRLSQVRPETLGQASRVPGITPAAVAVLGAYLSKSIRRPLNSREFQDRLTRRARRAGVRLDKELAGQLESYSGFS